MTDYWWMNIFIDKFYVFELPFIIILWFLFMWLNNTYLWRKTKTLRENVTFINIGRLESLFIVITRCTAFVTSRNTRYTFTVLTFSCKNKKHFWYNVCSANRSVLLTLLCHTPSIIRVIKSRRLRWAGHMARMGERRGAYRALVGKPEGRRPLRRPRRRWEDNIKMDLREVGWGGVD
jgi:hypothetical protein